MANPATKSNEKDLIKCVISVAHMGLFYGLSQESETIFQWCQEDVPQAQEAIASGRAFQAILEGDNEKAIRLLEEAFKKMSSDILKALFVTACVGSKKASRRKMARPIIDDIKRRLPTENPARKLVDITEGESRVT